MSTDKFPPNNPTLSDALEALQEYPYYTLPALMVMKENSPKQAADIPVELLQRVALSFSDKMQMPEELSDRSSIFDNFYPDERQSTPGTMDTIDTFLSNFGSADAHETEALEKLIFSGTPDYGAVLAAEEKDSIPDEQDITDPNISEQDRLINSYIVSSHRRADEPKPQSAIIEKEKEETGQSDKLTNTPDTETQKEKTAPQTPLTESLVRILVKNRNYSKAIEIISELSLNNPKKSIYFADQIRFLKKLIINENNK